MVQPFYTVAIKPPTKTKNERENTMSYASKNEARGALRSFIKLVGLAAACNTMEKVLNEYGQLTAFGRGRRTLEQQVFVEVRDGVRTLRKEECDRSDRKAASSVEVTTAQEHAVREMLTQYGGPAFANFLVQIFPENANLAICTNNSRVAQERLADRRAKFMPSETATKLGIVTLLPEAKPAKA